MISRPFLQDVCMCTYITNPTCQLWLVDWTLIGWGRLQGSDWLVWMSSNGGSWWGGERKAAGVQYTLQKKKLTAVGQRGGIKYPSTTKQPPPTSLPPPLPPSLSRSRLFSPICLTLPATPYQLFTKNLIYAPIFFCTFPRACFVFLILYPVIQYQ